MDLEATTLLAQARLEADDSAEVASVVQQLRRDKTYLFAEAKHDAAPVKTAGVKHRSDGTNALDSAAVQAARSGSRTDVQEYLRLRRNYV